MPRIIAVALPPWGHVFRVNEKVMMEIGKRRFPIRRHGPDSCEGEFCPLHKPSDHALKDANMILRFDKDALIERVCEHGVGHDDPDSLAWLKEKSPPGSIWRGEYAGSHGCDGCCR